MSRAIASPKAKSSNAAFQGHKDHKLSELLCSLELLRGMYLDIPTPQTAFIVLCAEPYVAINAYADLLAQRYGALGRNVFEYDLANTSEAELISMLKEFACTIEAGQITRPLILFKNMQSYTSPFAARLKRTLSTLYQKSCSFLITTHSEHKQFFEGLPEAFICYGSDIRVHGDQIFRLQHPASQGCLQELYELSHGIINLLECGLASLHSFDTKANTTALVRNLKPELSCCLHDSLRSELPLANRLLRLAMVVLGEGSREDLLDAIGSAGEKFNAEEFYAIAQTSAFFGITPAYSSFSVASFSKDETFAELINTEDTPIVKDLRLASQEFSHLIEKCVSLLVQQKRFARASLLMETFCSKEIRVRVGLSHACEFIDANQGKLVRQALHEAGGLFETSYMFEKQCARIAALLCNGIFEKACDLYARLPYPITKQQQVLYQQLTWMFEALRPLTHEDLTATVLRGILESIPGVSLLRVEADEPSAPAVPGSGATQKVKHIDVLTAAQIVLHDDWLAQKFYVHACVKRHLLRAQIKEAFAELLVQGLSSTVSGISDLLLAIDLAFVQLFANEYISDAERISLADIDAFLYQTDYVFMTGRLKAFRLSLDALVGVLHSVGELERLAHKCVAANLKVEAAFTFLCAGIQNMYDNAKLRAYIVLERAARLFDEARAEMLYRVALPLAAQDLQCDRAAVSVKKQIGRLYQALAICMHANQNPQSRAALEAASGVVSGVVPGTTSGAAFSAEKFDTAHTNFRQLSDPVSWLLYQVFLGREEVLAHACNRLKMQALPETEIPFLAVLTRCCGVLSQTLKQAMPAVWQASIEKQSALCKTYARSVREEHTGQMASLARAHHLYITTLGTFAVFCDGVPISKIAWKRKHAQTLVLLLALAPGHALTRMQIAEALWPDANYLSARDRLYVTLTAARKATTIFPGQEPFICASHGKIWLDPQLATVDVDIFEQAYTKIMSTQATMQTNLLESVQDKLQGQVQSQLQVRPQDRLQNRTLGDPQDLLQQIIKIQELYPGDVVLPDEVSGISYTTKETIKKHYIDVCVLGAQEALRQGKFEQAEWLACNAQQHDDLREDVLQILMKVYIQQGRAAKTKELFTEYARKLSQTTGLTVSKELKKLVAAAQSQVTTLSSASNIHILPRNNDGLEQSDDPEVENNVSTG